MTDYFLTLRRQVKKHRAVATSVVCAVMLATTYALILPAVTVDQDTASNDPGMSIESSESSSSSAAAAASSDEKNAEEQTEPAMPL